MHRALSLFALLIAVGVCGNYRELKGSGNSILGNKSSNTDTIYFDKSLPVYQARACLSSLLTAVVKANKKYYSPDEFFYSLSFNKGKAVKYLNITAEHWTAAKSLDYSGVIKLNNATFLCRGDFATDSLFYKVKHDFLRVKLRQINDRTDMPLNIEPSLRGAYQECMGERISLEVYTRGEMPGFKMKERRSVLRRE